MEIDKNKVYYSKEGFAFHVVKYNAKVIIVYALLTSKGLCKVF